MTGFTVEMVQQVLDAQPFNRLVGARATEVGDGTATIEIDIRDDLRQQYGVVHGGVLSYAADNVLTIAGGTKLGASVLTGGFSVNYLRTAREGTIRATAEVVHANSWHAVCRCEVSAVDGDGGVKVCAVAQGTIYTTG